MAFSENFSAYLADFGVAALLAGQSVTVIVESPYAEASGIATRETFAGLPTAALQTALLAAIAAGRAMLVDGATLDDVTPAAHGLPLEIGSVRYRVRVPQSDGTGWTLLPLERLQ